MKKVLIAVSSYQPAMIADMHRARMLAWELPKLGWNVEILTPAATEIRQDVIEAGSAPFFAPDTVVHEVGSFARPVFEAFGSRTHSWRTLLPFYFKGRKVLALGKFDLIYFSTTTFIYFALGPAWSSEFHIPYILDFHDPWVPERAAPTAGLKNRAINRVFKTLERHSVSKAAGLVSVSPAYVRILSARYQAPAPAWNTPARSSVIPCAALEQDLNEGGRQIKKTVGDEKIRLAYVGAGGPIMARSFDLICLVLKNLEESGDALAKLVTIQLYGTQSGWKPGDKKDLEAIARRHGLAQVDENPQRVSYRRSLELLLEADAALILGVDDAGYMPSKLFTYALSGKPLLASLHRESPAYALLKEKPALGHALWFHGTETMALPEASQVMRSFLLEARSRIRLERRNDLDPYLAPGMAEKHVQLFSACLSSPP